MPNPNAPALAPLPSRAVRLRRAAIFTLALAGAVSVLGSGHVPCGFAKIFGTPCPGCGSTRSMLALAHGDLDSYLRFNPLAPLMSALLGIVLVQAYVSLLRTGTFRGVAHGRSGILLARAGVVVGVLELALWIARFGGFLGGPVPV
ncbi:MAG: hypothetical protein JWP97_4958 [Labilithrix sp.]|nr:hypothetical protein [Labilithrix sp.]